MVDWESFYNSFRTPEFITGYEIQHRLGGGAFGEVYKARKLSIGKPYAIKFLKLDDQADRDVIQRELEQVRLFASIDHPNLVTIEDMGLVMEVPYLIMGYAGEETLSRRLKQSDMEPDAALRTFVQVCRGVLALHDRRLAHFDLKPGNVFLKGDVARVGDYGLAKLLVEGRSSLSFGRGTPHYMAPEMLKNRADHRADLYSLGVILYECLTGRVPYGAEVGGVVVREDDVPPVFPPDFPAALRPTVETCLRVSPNDRFDSVHELLEDMGQTARQGDSVFIPWDGTAAASDVVGRTTPPMAPLRDPQPRPTSPSGDPARPEDPATDGEPETSTRTDELRTAAGHLARGAVGVARGVWDGVTGKGGEKVPSESPADETQRPRRGSDETPVDDVVSVQTLHDPQAGDSTPTPPVLGRGLREGLAAAGAATPSAAKEGPATPRPSAPERSPRLPEPMAQGAGAMAVPVPPEESGGAVGAALSTAVLGAEILGALVTGPVLTVMRGARGIVDRSLHGLPGIFGATLKLGFFLLVCFCLGAVTALVFLGAVMGGNLYL